MLYLAQQHGIEITADQFAKGMAAGERRRQRKPLVVSAKYMQGRVHLELHNGCAFVFLATSPQGVVLCLRGKYPIGINR